jgi:ribosomal protein S27AE
MLEFESKLAMSVGNTIKVKVTDESVLPKFLYYWMQNLYNSGKMKSVIQNSVIPGAAISNLKAIPFYDKTLGDVASFSTDGEDFDFEIQRTGQNVGKVAAASDAKKDALAAKYQIDRERLDDLAEIDPTPNGVYTEWLTKAYKVGIRSMQTMMDSFRDRLVLFDRLKNSPQFRERNSGDINSYTTAAFISLMDSVSREDLSKNDQLKEIEKNKEKYLMKGVTPLGKEGSFAYYKVTTVEAAMIMSKGTHWCTQGETHARNYLSKAPLYVIVIPDSVYNGDEEDYTGSDKAAQFYIPADSSRIECQDTEGSDIGEHYGDDDEAYVVREDYYWRCFQFLAKHDDRIRNFMENNTIIDDEDDYESNKSECAQCGSSVRNEDMYYSDITNEDYCDIDCFRNAHEDYIKAQMDLLLPPLDTSEEDAAKEELDQFINAQDSPEANLFNAVRAAVDRMNRERDIENSGYTPPVLTPKWHMTNIRSALRSRPATIEKVFQGDVTKEDFERCDKEFTPLYNASKSADEKWDEMVDKVKEEFDLNHTNVRNILISLGYLNPDYVKQSSWVNSLLTGAKGKK